MALLVFFEKSVAGRALLASELLNQVRRSTAYSPGLCHTIHAGLDGDINKLITLRLVD
jgi:hypothetical protein